MALICSPNGNAHLISHELAFSEPYVFGVDRQGSKARANSGSYRSRPELFCLPQPHIRLSPCVPDDPCTPHQLSGKKHRKRRRLTELNVGELAALEYHQQIESTLEAALSAVLLSSAGALYFSKQSSVCSHHQPADPKTIVLLGHGDSLVELSQTAAQLEVSPEGGNASMLRLVDSDDHKNLSEANIFNCMVDHCCATSCQVTMLGGQYLLPPHCSFLMSDIKQLHVLLEQSDEKPYDLIVMDPPWENKSIARSQRYCSLPLWQLKRLPISQLAAPHALVVIWVTNRQLLIKNICKQLLPFWGVHLLAVWHWLKVTCHGEPVVPMDSSHKRPYETLLVCRCCCKTSGCSDCMICCPVEKPTTSVEGADGGFNPVPAKQVCLRHSSEEGETEFSKAIHHCHVEEESLENSSIVLQPCEKTLVTNKTSLSDSGCTEYEACCMFPSAMPSCGNKDFTNAGLATKHLGRKNSLAKESEPFFPKNFRSHLSRNCQTSNDRQCPVAHPDEKVSAKNSSEHFDPVWEHHTIVSTPCAIHSHKPPLDAVLSPYLPKGPRCLELFARSLRSGWTSWGNEVIRLQHVDFFREGNVESDVVTLEIVKTGTQCP